MRTCVIPKSIMVDRNGRISYPLDIQILISSGFKTFYIMDDGILSTDDLVNSVVTIKEMGKICEIINIMRNKYSDITECSFDDLIC